jgi:hypothetical protein
VILLDARIGMAFDWTGKIVQTGQPGHPQGFPRWGHRIPTITLWEPAWLANHGRI